jgi:diphthine-ammonia ligase
MAPSKLKVIALISGGKDSLFSILHCLANGHEVIALANLYPNDVQQDSHGHQVENDKDTNSYMYQTVGHSVIRHYEEALELPLYRRPITGAAVDQSMDYDSRGSTSFKDQSATFDEAEDLFKLLQEVKENLPEANAVSTGAILSTYQRTRVESVAIRLGLTPLSYLWQYPYLPDYYEDEGKLLEDMHAVGQDSRIIKVADGRLDSRLLWKQIIDPMLKLKLGSNTGMFKSEVGDILGEGGQYETMTFSGPRPLWKKAIDVERWSEQAPDGGSAAAKPEEVKIKALSDTAVQYNDNSLPRPKTFDHEFRSLYSFGLGLGHPIEDDDALVLAWDPLVQKNFPELRHMVQDIAWRVQENGTTCRISNMQADGSTAVEQMENIKAQLAGELVKHNATPALITSTTLILRRMEDFAAINPVYGSLFTTVNPPSRVTIACGDLLQDGTDVLLSIVIDHGKRRGLHVQSQSYWAPANIGPYSQSIAISLKPLETPDFESMSPSSVTPELVHVAGQIPLVPSSMKLAAAEDWDDYDPHQVDQSKEHQDLCVQAILSLQHLWRVGRAMKVAAWTGAIVFTPKTNAAKTIHLATLTCALWKEVHQSEWEVAAGEKRRGHGELSPESKHGSSELPLNENTDGQVAREYDIWYERNNPYRKQVPEHSQDVKDSRSVLPDFHAIAEFRSKPFPPCFAVEVEQLPRGAPMEWWSYGLSHSKVRYDTYRKDHFVLDKVTSIESGLTVSYIRLKNIEDLGFWDYIKEFTLNPDVSQPGSSATGPFTTVYATEALPQSFLETMKPQIVPCHSILALNQHTDYRIAALVVVVVGVHPNPSEIDNLANEKEVPSSSMFRVDNSLKTMDCRPVFLWPTRNYNVTEDGEELDTIDPNSR